jgi:hypothetical protein
VACSKLQPRVCSKLSEAKIKTAFAGKEDRRAGLLTYLEMDLLGRIRNCVDWLKTSILHEEVYQEGQASITPLDLLISHI